MAFSDFQNLGETYTNNEFITFLHPWNPDLPYTYDTYDFDYCSDQGYPFEPMLTPPDESMTSSRTGGSGGGAGGPKSNSGGSTGGGSPVTGAGVRGGV